MRIQLSELVLSCLVACSVAQYKYDRSFGTELLEGLRLRSLPKVVNISAKKDWGRWDGWGVSLCWWANALGDQKDLAEAVFSSHSVKLDVGTVPGLGLNIARYNAGASSWRQSSGKSMVASPNIPQFKQIEGFWQDEQSGDPSSQSWDWDADRRQVAMLLSAKALGADLFELFSNSPMWWMLRNRDPSGAENGSEDNLKAGSARQHAHYLATVAAKFKATHGLHFASIEPFNEPISPWWTADKDQEGCHFERSTQAEVLHALKVELQRLRLHDTVTAASDEDTYEDGLATWNSFDVKTKGSIGRVNVHGYQALEGPRAELYSAVHPKALWNTEYGDDDGTGLTMAAVINLDFQKLHNTAWCYWQIADESDGWGLLKFSPENRTLLEINMKWFVLAHYTRHIRPGMQILDSSDVSTVSAYDEDRRVLVLVTTNHGSKKSLSFDLSSFSHVGGPVSVWWTKANSPLKA